MLLLPRASYHVLGVVVLAAGLSQSAVAESWPQWGGPNRNFNVDMTGLAPNWPDGGPKKLWNRSLGTGFSGIAIANNVIYTMYRTDKKDKNEYTIALDATTGKTLWQHEQLAAVPDSVAKYGKNFSGPNATPLVVGNRVFTVGRNAVLHCFQASDGKLLWKHALQRKFGAQTHTCGFSSSPIAFGNTIILPVGRLKDYKATGRSLIAFDQETGKVVWKKQSFQSWHSSPMLIEYQGKEQLVQCTNSALIGVDPNNGVLLWKYEYPAPDQFESVWISPVWDGKDTILFSSQKVGCAVQLTQSNSKTVAKQLWSNSKTPYGFGTPILLGDMLVGGKRGRNAAFIGVDIKTGKQLWFERVLPGATIIGDQNRVIALDSDGQLALATANREGFKITSQFKLTDQYSFTAPALVGSTLFVRDEKNIMALDLGITAK